MECPPARSPKTVVRRPVNLIVLIWIRSSLPSVRLSVHSIRRVGCLLLAYIVKIFFARFAARPSLPPPSVESDEVTGERYGAPEMLLAAGRRAGGRARAAEQCGVAIIPG